MCADALAAAPGLCITEGCVGPAGWHAVRGAAVTAVVVEPTARHAGWALPGLRRLCASAGGYRALAPRCAAIRTSAVPPERWRWSNRCPSACSAVPHWAAARGKAEARRRRPGVQKGRGARAQGRKGAREWGSGGAGECRSAPVPPTWRALAAEAWAWTPHSGPRKGRAARGAGPGGGGAERSGAQARHGSVPVAGRVRRRAARASSCARPPPAPPHARAA